MYVYLLIDCEEFHSRKCVLGVFTSLQNAIAVFASDPVEDQPTWIISEDGHHASSDDEVFEIHRMEVQS